MSAQDSRRTSTLFDRSLPPAAQRLTGADIRSILSRSYVLRWPSTRNTHQGGSWVFLGEERRGGACARGPPRDSAATGTEDASAERTNANAGSVAVSAGALGVKAASVCSSGDIGLRRCRYHGADGTARWVGLGVIADNLVSTAIFLNARAAAQRIPTK